MVLYLTICKGGGGSYVHVIQQPLHETCLRRAHSAEGNVNEFPFSCHMRHNERKNRCLNCQDFALSDWQLFPHSDHRSRRSERERENAFFFHHTRSLLSFRSIVSSAKPFPLVKDSLYAALSHVPLLSSWPKSAVVLFTMLLRALC